MPLVPTSSRGGDGLARGTLVPAQILALFTTPITLVAGTPGALTIPDTFTTFYKSGATAYTLAGLVNLDVGGLGALGSPVTLTNFGNVLAAGPPFDVSFDDAAAVLGGLFNSADTSAVLGQGIKVYADGGNPTLGNLTVTYELTYRVIVP